MSEIRGRCCVQTSPGLQTWLPHATRAQAALRARFRSVCGDFRQLPNIFSASLPITAYLKDVLGYLLGIQKLTCSKLSFEPLGNLLLSMPFFQLLGLEILPSPLNLLLAADVQLTAEPCDPAPIPGEILHPSLPRSSWLTAALFIHHEN